jgi:Ca2+-dependent lipid-binding protein
VTAAQVRRSTSHPVWDEQLRLLVHVPELQALHLEVRDWDMLNASDCIGRQYFCGPYEKKLVLSHI